MEDAAWPVDARGTGEGGTAACAKSSAGGEDCGVIRGGSDDVTCSFEASGGDCTSPVFAGAALGFGSE